MEGGGLRAGEDKRCPDLSVDCGTGVLALRPAGLRVCPADTSATVEKRMHSLCHLVMRPGCDLVGSEVTEDEPSRQIFCLCC